MSNDDAIFYRNPNYCRAVYMLERHFETAGDMIKLWWLYGSARNGPRWEQLEPWAKWWEDLPGFPELL